MRKTLVKSTYVASWPDKRRRLPEDSSCDEMEVDNDDEFSGGDDSEKEDDTAELVSSLIVSAVAPEGYKVIEELPPLDLECVRSQRADRQANPVWVRAEERDGLVHGHAVAPRSLSRADMKKTLSANFVVKQVHQEGRHQEQRSCRQRRVS